MKTKDKLTVINLPTPIQHLERLSREYGVEVYVKRDDLTGSGLTGNKIRKLEYQFAEGLKTGCNAVITCGGPQSNHARATAVLARQMGWKPVLLLGGDPNKSVYNGNLLLDRLLEADIRWAQDVDWFDGTTPMMEEIARSMEKDGYRTLVIPLGGSNPTGYMGYYNAGLEIRRQEAEMNIDFDFVFCAVGTGGTLGGLLLAKHLTHWTSRVIGVNVMDGAEFFKTHIHTIMSEFANEHGLESIPAREEIEIADGFWQPEYSVSTPAVRDVIRKVASQEGLFLDPVYTGKAFLGMETMIRDGRIPKGSKTLFIHTGGIFGLFTEKSWE